MAAALPVLTTISRVARTEVTAGAMRVSLASGSPSAVTETQEVWAARMNRVNGGGDFGFGVCTRELATGGLTSESAGVETEPVVENAVWGVRACFGELAGAEGASAGVATATIGF